MVKSANHRTSRAGAPLLALTLASSLAVFGCTTNRTPGNGQPGATAAPGAAPSATPGASSGSGTTSGPGMASSSVDPSVDAAAAMAARQAFRGRELGPVSPSGTQA